MLATLIEAPFDDPNWVYETKWDGFRVIARLRHSEARLYSRNGRNVTQVYPGIAKVLAKIRHEAVLDGELVALDARGRSRFQLLQQAQRSGGRLRYCVFDLMRLDGKDLRRLPLLERKARLRRILPVGAAIRLSRHVRGRGIRAFRAAERRGLEGIVAKRAEGRYHSGRRTREWLKIKTAKRQETVVVGFTRPQRSRQYFGSLVLAVREGGAWRYVGHTGTGFDAASLKSIHARLIKLVQPKKPLAASVPNERATTWVRPRLLAEVKFTEWTRDGRMRHPAFLGLRTDKAPSQVVRERALRARGR